MFEITDTLKAEERFEKKAFVLICSLCESEMKGEHFYSIITIRHTIFTICCSPNLNRIKIWEQISKMQNI